MIKAILCDIDGTLLLTRSTGKPTEKRFFHSIKDVFGVKSVYDREKFNGWTDYRILSEMVKPLGITKEELDQKLDQVAESMIEVIREISGRKKYFSVIPEANEFLRKIHPFPIYKGVFTGNLSKVGKWKLSTHDLDSFFTFALYGDYMKDKAELLEKELLSLLKSFKEEIKPADCCVIGDTPEDIKAGKQMGVKTIGVMSSAYTKKSEMELQKPDLLVSSLADLLVIPFILL